MKLEHRRLASEPKEVLKAEMVSDNSNAPAANESNKRLERRLENLTQENGLLKEQLEIERRNSHRNTEIGMQLLRE